ncbi:hypothetical protein DKX38_015427 [Salix brachista]|uniref:Uncharacterized protein n=1 Tax=Salix brachista TaxID=2182728 RepID=A0A5N5L560_9ROSI|nr:hypothetical protein DKX38_015427 [Salix brachista]
MQNRALAQWLLIVTSHLRMVTAAELNEIHEDNAALITTKLKSEDVEGHVTAAELKHEDQDFKAPVTVINSTDTQKDSFYVIAAPEIVIETKSLAFEQSEKLETTIFPKGGYEAQEGVGRLSTESNPDNLNIHANVSLQNPRLLPQYNQESIREKQVEEKVIALERSDSERSRTPFLGFLKEEEAHVLVAKDVEE